ncbi:cornifelin-like [Scomber scombrus]|uniref:cornifelin-like n=1 Tax=Scomber scombrus TaxID=13677 RepID=UPI002DDC8B09|nr:cornifelin-like [Scomber scombrus]
MAEKPLTEWKSGLLDCFEEASTCCYGFWCCPCLACTVSNRFGESYCLPLCDICSPAVFAACGIPLFVPPAVLSLRASIRNKYGIKGSLCKDIAASCFCMWCSWCQMHRELKHRNKAPTVINVQTPTVVQMQPAPMMMAPPVGFVSQSSVIMASY